MAGDTNKIIPLFPLPSTVMFPCTYLPLHIFEPRYRQMVQDAIEGDRIIGMVLLKEGWEPDYHGNPPIHEIGCVGRIVRVQSLEDGRFNIVLYGTEKFSVAEQFHDKPYRQGRVETDGREGAPERALPVTVRSGLVTALLEFARQGGLEKQMDAVLGMKLADERLVHLLSSELDLTPVEKQFLLESADYVQQCRRLTDLLRFMSSGDPSVRKSGHPLDASP